MIESYTPQLVVFEGCPASLGQVGRRLLQRGAPTAFLCVLAPGEDSAKVKRAWEFSLQQLDPSLALFIIHACPAAPGRGALAATFEAIAEFACELLRSRQTSDLDVLFLSEDSSWRASRRLAKALQGLQTKLEKVSPTCLVRRV